MRMILYDTRLRMICPNLAWAKCDSVEIGISSKLGRNYTTLVIGTLIKQTLSKSFLTSSDLSIARKDCLTSRKWRSTLAILSGNNM